MELNSTLLFFRNEVSMFQHSKTSPLGFQKPETWKIEIPISPEPAQHAALTQNFIDAILDGVPLIAPGEEGIHSIELANVILYSGLMDKTIELPLDAAAKVLEVAGGFAPTIGVMGTVVGLIDVLRQFSSLSTVASGVGAAFTSTFYGLALANIALLPVAHRIRAWTSETFDLQEMMTEGALCLFDGMHPRLIRQRLRSYLNVLPGHDQSLL